MGPKHAGLASVEHGYNGPRLLLESPAPLADPRWHWNVGKDSNVDGASGTLLLFWPARSMRSLAAASEAYDLLGPRIGYCWLQLNIYTRQLASSKNQKPKLTSHSYAKQTSNHTFNQTMR